jgi:hypothetical protein
VAEFSNQQVQLMARARRRAVQLKATRVEKLALAAAGIVESNVTHLTGGDRDSTGFLQQRPSMGWGPIGESVEKDTEQFLAAARQYRGKINNPGELAQAVQRSGFPDRYGQRMGDARQLLDAARGAGGGRGQNVRAPGAVGSMNPGRAPQFNPGGEKLDAKGAMIDALLDPNKKAGLLDRFRMRIESGQYTTLTPPSVTPGLGAKYLDPQKQTGHGQPGQPSGGVGQGTTGGAGTTSTGVPIRRIVNQAEKIDQAKVPYLWGGGHQRRIGKHEKVTPMDCSGSVSRLLGINPLVSGQFAKWGKPGRDPDGGFTVWANGEHVLVEIGGHFWGTSGSNPGGGAGWIPSSAVSKSYLSRFTPRH